MRVAGGLPDAVIDYLILLASTDLSGFAEMRRDFSKGSEFPRLVLETGTNVITLRTDKSEFRTIDIDFEILANSEQQAAQQGSKLDSVLNELAENGSAITALMPSGAGVREMDIVNQISKKEESNLWSVKISTEWDIGITRN